MSQQPRLPILLVCLLIALPAQVVLHELGHIAAARLTGDSEATVRLAQQEPGGWLRLGAAHYDGTKLSGVGRVVAPLGGLLLTQCVALALLGGSTRWSQRARTYAAVMVGALLLDVLIQGGWAIITDVPRPPQLSGIDLADVMSTVHGRTGVSVAGMKAGLFLLLVGYGLVGAFTLRRRLGSPSWSA
jgi:hypothetical protein